MNGNDRPEAAAESVAVSVSEPEGERKRGPSQATVLVRLAEERFRLGRDPGGDLFAVSKTGPPLVRMLRGSGSSLRATLADVYAQEHDAAPSSTALSSALLVLEGRALRAEPEPLALRVGQRDGGVVLDLGDESGRAVVISANGWQVVTTPPVLFRRSALTGPLPAPERGGSLDELRELVHVADDAWPLALGWLLIALLPEVPAPVLFFRGAQGAGKSSAARLLSRLVDPSPAQLRSAPRDPSEWTITASSSRVVPLDNLSRIPEWLGDALCRVVTGDGLARRALYTDAETVVFSFKRALILTAIEIGGVRGDLADRLLPVELERIDERERRTEAEVEAAFAAAHPRVLGSLLDLLAAVLRVLPHTRPERLPRLADAGRVFAALDTVAGVRSFEAFCGIAGRLAYEVVEDDPVAEAIRSLVERRGAFEGTTSELLAAITPGDKPRGWPESPQALAGRLTRAEEALRLIGVRVERERVGKSRRRLVRIVGVEVSGEKPSASSALSATAWESGFRAAERVGRGADDPLSKADEADEGGRPLFDPSSALQSRSARGIADEADEGLPTPSTCAEELRGSPAWIAAASAVELADWRAERLDGATADAEDGAA